MDFYSEDIVVLYGTIGKVIITKHKEKHMMFIPAGTNGSSMSILQEYLIGNIRHATQEEKIKYIEIEHNIYWHTAIQTHVIGDYQIIQDIRGLFNPYINFISTNKVYTSIEAAMIGVLCHKLIGADETLSKYIFKIFGIKEGFGGELINGN